MRRCLIVVTCLFCLFTISAWASDSVGADAELQADIMKLLDLMEVRDILRQSGLESASLYLNKARVAYPDVADAAAKTIEAEIGKLLDEKLDILMSDTALIYAKYFTHEDIIGLIAFHETPLGKKMIAAKPGILRESMALKQRWDVVVQPEVNSRILELLLSDEFRTPKASAGGENTVEDSGPDPEVERLRALVENYPANLQAWIKLGNRLYDTDQYRESIDAYTKALEIDPNNVNVITDRAAMFERIGEREKAEEELKKAIKLDPAHLASAYNLVMLNYDQNDAEGAIEAWEEYLSRNPPAEMVDKARRELDTLRSMVGQ